MRRIVPGLLVLLLALPASAQRHRPVKLHKALTELIADLGAVEAALDQLRGRPQTLDSLRKRLEHMRGRITRLIARVPPVIAPHGPPDVAPPPPVPVGPQAMAAPDFARLVATVKAESFDARKVGVIRTAAQSNYFEVDQVLRLCKVFSFGRYKLEVVAAVKSHILDMKNAYRLYGAFTFDSEKKQLHSGAVASSPPPSAARGPLTATGSARPGTPSPPPSRTWPALPCRPSARSHPRCCGS